jgi:hypothetical protein
MSAAYIAPHLRRRWDYSRSREDGCSFTIHPDETSEPLADVLSREGDEGIARLMASAPELMEALILMVRTHDEPAESSLQELREQQWIAQARAAIAKATGEQS